MKIKSFSPLAQLSGGWAGSDLIYATNSATGTSYAYGRSPRKDPKTYDQELTRRVGRAAAEHWGELTDAQRSAWDRFAAETATAASRRRGYDICREAARMRLMLGLDARADAPRLGFPAPVVGVSIEPSTDPKEFTFRIEHRTELLAGYMLLVKLTPQTAKVSRKPLVRDARGIRGYGARSAAALPETGGTVTFTDARYGVAAGGRFGVAVTVIRTEDGLASPALFFDLRRGGETPPAQNNATEGTK